MEQLGPPCDDQGLALRHLRKNTKQSAGQTEWKIPVFTCQLAQDSTDQPKKLKGIKRLEVKLDGVRVLAVVSGQCVPCLQSQRQRV
jgi:ATP-dependent DNA ligase